MEKPFSSDSTLIAAVMRQYVTKERLNSILLDRSLSVYEVINIFQMYVYETFQLENPGMNQLAVDEALMIVNKDIVKLVKGDI